MIDYIEAVEKNVNVEEGKKVIEKYLITAYLYGPSSNKIMAQRLNLPVPVVTAIKKEFIRFGLIIKTRVPVLQMKV